MDLEGKIYQPVQSSNSSEEDSAIDHVFVSALYTSKRRMIYVNIFLAILLIGSNGFWMKQWMSSEVEAASSLDSPYYNSTTTSLRPHHWVTDYSTNNRSVSEKLWGSLFPAGAGVVSVPTTWARERQLPASMPDLENPGHSIYFTAVYHQMHCLTVIRASIYHYADGKEQSVSSDHVIHCLDSLRQSLMCNLDSTLLYTESGLVFGDGQLHVCRDWEAFFSWVEDHEKVI